MKGTRDVQVIPWQGEEQIVVATDASGGVGEKAKDHVHVPYEVVSYYAARVALLECMSVGATPFTFLVQNFSGDEPYQKMIDGINRALGEANQAQATIAGSTESNMVLEQSCLGVTVIGRVHQSALKIGITPKDAGIALLGKPLVGEEVVSQEKDVFPLKQFDELLQEEGVYEIIPVGSKGVKYELGVLAATNEWNTLQVPLNGNVDLTKSSGPATSLLITFDGTMEALLKAKYSSWWTTLASKIST
ncbi:ATPase [Halalkalibacterium halodurans]|uniref:ATPase n=1 Tax=Halalkalibacterium halodurans TaxID=86665 RepID=UPI002E1FD75E|nr:ATPase [Halalkalibacterium halodurans]